MQSVLGRPAARLTCVLFCLLVAAQAGAEVTSIQGSVRSTLEEILSDSGGDSIEVLENLPGTTNQFPLVAIAQLLDDAESGAGSVASQLADPATSNELNPSEFALNLALASADGTRHYAGTATSQEIREIVFTTSDFPGTENGDSVRAEGRVWIDGALTIFSVDRDRDLSDAEVVVRVRVVHSADGEVFAGQVRLAGSGAGAAVRTSDGRFATISTLVSEVGNINPDFGTVWIVVIPEAIVPYEFNGVIGQTFTLTATYELEAVNLPDGVGCAAVVGTPFETLAQVVAITQNQDAAARLKDTIASQREDARSQPITICPVFAVALTAVPLMGLAVGRVARRRGPLPQ